MHLRSCTWKEHIGCTTLFAGVERVLQITAGYWKADCIQSEFWHRNQNQDVSGGHGMKTPEQLKGTIRHIAQQKNLRAQEVLQMYFFERILVRLASSGYRQNFILKGGLLISSIIGISERTTMDMDTTVRGIPMEEKEIISVVTEIISLDAEDGIAFEFQSIEPIRDDDAYNNFRVHVLAKYGKIRAPMKIDITTGDVITPSAIEYSYPLSFEKRVISILHIHLRA